MTKAWCFATAALIAIGTAIAIDFPKRRPGKWELSMVIADSKMPPQTQFVCLDEATDALLYRYGLAMSQKMCDRTDWKRDGDKLIGNLTCKTASGQATVHSEYTFRGDTAYHMEGVRHYEPPLHGKRELRFSQDAKWLGACPSDMKPGDLVTKPSPSMPFPLKLNLNDMFKEAH